MHFLFFLATALVSLTSAFTPVSSPADELQIRNKLSLYTIALDTKNFALLDGVFATNAVVDYRVPGASVLHGLPDIKSYLTKSLTGFVTQHTLSSTVVEEVNKNGGVNSTTYLMANYYGQGNYTGQAAYVPGKYLDAWTKQKGEWVIKTRTLELFPPGIIGDREIVLTPAS